MEREFDRLLSEYHDAFNRAISMRDNDEDLLCDLDAARSKYLDPAIDKAETLEDCKKIQTNLITNKADKNRNILLIEKLVTKTKEIQNQSTFDFAEFFRILG